MALKQSPVLAPRRLFTQIIEMQAFFYVIGFCLVSFVLVVGGTPWSVDYIFDWHPVRADTTLGWTLALVWILDTVFSVLAMTVIVGRSKLALDFALTLHLLHLVVVVVYSGSLPASWLWWALQAVSSALLTLLGTWTTQWRELKRSFFEDYELLDIEQTEPNN